LHNVTAFYITTAFVVMGVGAWLLRHNRAVEDSHMMIRMALGLLIILVPLQIYLGDLHGLNTREYQPAKLAAIEGIYATAQPAPLTLFGIPDDRAATMRYPIEVPHLGSLILTHSWDGSIKGLREWPESDRPPVALPFFAFRIMVGIGVVMLFVADCGHGSSIARKALGFELVLAALSVGGAAGVHCRHRWVDNYGSRPATLDCLRPDAYGRVAIPFADSARCNAVVSTLYHRVPDHVSNGHRIHGGAGATRASTAGSRIGTG